MNSNLQNENISWTRTEQEAALARLAAIVEFSDDAIISKDLNSIITSWNKGAEKIFGYTSGEMVGTSIMRLIPADRQNEEIQILGKIRRGENVDCFETQRQTKDGRLIHVSITESPIKDGSGNVIGASKVARDISERIRIDEARRMSESRYRTLFDCAPDGIVIADANSFYLDANTSICRMLGYTREEFIGLHASNIVSQKEIQNIAPALGAIKARTNYHREWQFKRKDGSFFDAEVIATVMPDGNLLGMIRDITERKRFQKELDVAHEKMRQLLKHSPAVIYTLKIDGEKITPVVISDNIERLLGFIAEEANTYSWWVSHLHPEDRDRVLATLQMALTQDGYSMEYRVLHKDGTYRWVEDNNRLLRDADGRPNFMVGVWTDISERKHLEEVLRKTSRQETGRKAKKIIWELVVILGLTALVGAFASFTEVFEPPLDKLVSKFKGNYDDLFLPPIILLLGFLAFSYRRWRDAQGRVSEQANIQEALRKLHGELEKRIHQRTVELANANDALRIEIAERKRAEEELQQSEHRFREMLENLKLIAMTLDKKGKVTFCNDYLLQLTGRTREEIIGADWFEKFIPSGNTALKKLFSDNIGDGKIPSHHENPIKTKNGGLREIVWNNTLLRDADGNIIGTASIGEDITDQRKLEEQFRQSQKMEAIGQLASGVAHDFNNILAVIQMQADLLKADGGLSPVQSEFVGEIGEAAQRAAALTRQLLLFSRKEKLQPRDLDLNESINDMTKLLRRTLGEHIQLQFKFSMQPLFVHADASMMDQVLMNLAVNSRDAMPKGGQLIIETSAVEFDEAAASHSANIKPGKFVCLSVSDTGCGIPKENLSRIFEPFFTTKEVGKGTGLGLATVFGIVQQHNGWIDVYSEVGHGTTFRIYLPRLARISDQKFAAPMTEKAQGGGETILLVEDEPRLRASVKNILSRLGYNVLEAANGVEALEVWKKHHIRVGLAQKVFNRQEDEIHLLLTDMVMPGGMTGKELGERLLKENPKLKVIYASGYSAEVAGNDFPLEEGVNFLTKPFEAQKLAQAIRDNLDART